MNKYILIKDKGLHENVYLRNTDTHAEINLGRMSFFIMKILEGDGFQFSDETKSTYIDIKEDFRIALSSEGVAEIKKLVTPIKTTRKAVKSETIEQKKPKQIVNVLDIIYGR